MMFNNHRMSLVTDLRILGDQIRNIDFINVVAITTSEAPDGPNIFYAGILIPPTEMLMRWAEGDPNVIPYEYPQYLMSKDCDEMIIALIASLTKKNVVLYIPRNEFDIYGPVFLNHIAQVYGIICDTPTSQFSVNPNYMPSILSKFYLMDIMDATGYLEAYPYYCLLPDYVINKLAMELGPAIFKSPMTFNEYRDYFNRIIASKQPQGEKKLLTRAVVR